MLYRTPSISTLLRFSSVNVGPGNSITYTHTYILDIQYTQAIIILYKSLLQLIIKLIEEETKVMPPSKHDVPYTVYMLQ